MKKWLSYMIAPIGLLALSSTAAQAIDVEISGFIRQEVAVGYSDDLNPAVQHGNPFNDRAVSRNITTGVAPGSEVVGGTLADIGGTLGLPAAAQPLADLLDSLGAPLVVGALPVGQTYTRPIETQENTFNLVATRIEIDVGISLTDWMSASIKMRAYGDWDIYDQYGDPRHMDEGEFFAHGNGRLEYADRQFMVDFPNAYVEIFTGPLWIRMGNQQIAWGEALFFRVFDVPNGLDTRRHLILDYAQEEYADERRSAPGIRGSYRFLDNYEIELFGQMASPTIFPAANSPYAVVPDQFVVHQTDSWNEVEDNINYGGRITAQWDDFTMQIMATHRTNPDGAFRWTKSGVNKDLPGLPGTGAIVAETPYEADPRGVHSQHEWFWYAGFVRLDGVRGFDTSLTGPFAAAQLLGARPCNGDMECVKGQVDLFNALMGGTRGHIERRWFEEDIYGIAMNYIITADMESFFDQMVVRAEATYTPERVFTGLALEQEFLTKDEWTGSIVIEKWHRWTEAFPATFMVFEYMFKSESDLFGRQLGVMGGSETGGPGEGIDDFHAFAFAFQQPIHPTLVWRLDFAVLWDVQGGWLFQPGLRWKPGSAYTVELNVTHNISNDENKDVIGTIDYADEVALRATFQF